MNRTSLFVATAVTLALAALVFHSSAKTTQPAPPPPALVLVEPDGAPTEEVMKVNDAAVAQTSRGGAVELFARISHPALSAGLNDVYAQVDLTARREEAGLRQPANLAVVIDRSGSMRGDKMNRAREAALHLIDRLESADRLSVVHYGGDVQSLPSMLATAENKQVMRTFVRNIYDNGDTNIGGGLTEASVRIREYTKAFAASRIILLSDGQPTSGLVSTPALVGLVEGLRAQGFTVSAIGVGADFNENLMSAMANSGGGFYGYLDRGERLAEVFSRELDQATSAVARQVEVVLEVPEGVTVLNVFGHHVATGSRTVTLPLYDLSSGQTARVLARLSARIPEGSGRVPIIKATVRYTEVKTGERMSSDVATVSELVGGKAQVTARLDKDVAAAGMRALGAMMVTQAAQAYQAGRTEESAGLFTNARGMFAASADSLGGDTRLVAEGGVVGSYQQKLRGSTGEALNHNVKAIQKKGLKDFGNSNTY